MIDITAHSGCDGTQPDSLSSVKKGISLGADTVEIDIRRNEKGQLVLSHDEPKPDAVPLEEAFSLIREAGIKVNCDLKTYDLLYDVLAMAGRFGIDRGHLIFSGSVSHELLRKDPSIVKQARIFWNLEEIRAEDQTAEAVLLGVEALNLRFSLAEEFLNRGIPLSVWTVNDEENMKRWLHTDGVCNVTTKEVQTALKLR